MKSTHRRVSAVLRLGALAASIATLCAQQAGAGPVKILIMAGQSNTQGHGEISPSTTQGTLSYVTTPANDPTGRYQFLKDGANWAVRSDVLIHYQRNVALGSGVDVGDLTVGFGANSGKTTIGPELGFGHVMGKVHDNQVLLIKTSWGCLITQNGPPQIYVDPLTFHYFLRYTRRTDYVAAGLTYTAQFAADSLGAGSFENVAGGSVVGTGTGNTAAIVRLNVGITIDVSTASYSAGFGASGQINSHMGGGPFGFSDGVPGYLGFSLMLPSPSPAPPCSAVWASSCSSAVAAIEERPSVGGALSASPSLSTRAPADPAWRNAAPRAVLVS